MPCGEHMGQREEGYVPVELLPTLLPLILLPDGELSAKEEFGETETEIQIKQSLQSRNLQPT